jgi:hypothetical protein
LAACSLLVPPSSKSICPMLTKLITCDSSSARP